MFGRYNIKSAEVIYFGDARSDYEAAKENDVDFVGIVNEHSKELEGLDRITQIEYFNTNLVLQGEHNA